VIITDEDTVLLHRLLDEIQIIYGTKIGYSCPQGSFVADDCVFVIYTDDTTTWLLHRDDFSHDSFGMICQDKVNEFCLHDDCCREFLDRLRKDLEVGHVRPFPSMHKDLGSRKITVVKGWGWYDIDIDYGHKKEMFRSTLHSLRDRVRPDAVARIGISDIDSDLKQALITSVREDAENLAQIFCMIQELDISVVDAMVEEIQK